MKSVPINVAELRGTIPASRSRAEQEFNSEVGSSWSQRKPDSIPKLFSPAKQKFMAIIKVLKDDGFMDDPIVAKAANTELLDWLMKLDQDDLIVSNPGELAQAFIESL